MLLADLDFTKLAESPSTLALFLAFLIPGFIAKRIYCLFIASGEQDFSKQLPEVVAYSAIHYALFGFLLLLPMTDLLHTVIVYLVVLIVPVLEGPAILLIRDYGKYKAMFGRDLPEMILRPTRTPWDERFSQPGPAIVRIRLKGGEWVGGYLGKGSLSSTYPNPEQLFISQAWKFDEDGYLLDDTGSAGLLVIGAELSYIEVDDAVDDAGDDSGGDG